MTRRFWVLIHRYAGLYMAFFLTIAGLTGSILAFDGEIRDWLDPPSRVAVRAQPMLDPVALRERALALAPLGQITSPVSFRREPDEAYTVSFEPRTDPATGKPYALPFNTLTLDPYTGDEIGRSQRPEGLWPITRQNFISVIIALHYRLAVPGSIGTWLFGIAALIWTLDCFVGFYLTLPTRRRRPPPNLPLYMQGEGTVSPLRRGRFRGGPATLLVGALETGVAGEMARLRLPHQLRPAPRRRAVVLAHAAGPGLVERRLQPE